MYQDPKQAARLVSWDPAQTGSMAEWVVTQAQTGVRLVDSSPWELIARSPNVAGDADVEPIYVPDFPVRYMVINGASDVVNVAVDLPYPKISRELQDAETIERQKIILPLRTGELHSIVITAIYFDETTATEIVLLG